jgi:hypothetical protein
MIDRAIFAAGMGVLCDIFGREIGVPAMKAYYAVLGGRLTTAEFERAVNLAISQDIFWPTPARLLALVGRDTETAALSALTKLSSRLRLGGGHLHFAAAEYGQLDVPTRKGISAAGGLRAICECRPENAAALQRRFVTAYAAAVNRAPALTFNEPNQLSISDALAASLKTRRSRA